MISSRSLYVPETHGLNTETTPETGQEGGEEKMRMKQEVS